MLLSLTNLKLTASVSNFLLIELEYIPHTTYNSLNKDDTIQKNKVVQEKIQCQKYWTN